MSASLDAVGPQGEWGCSGNLEEVMLRKREGGRGGGSSSVCVWGGGGDIYREQQSLPEPWHHMFTAQPSLFLFLPRSQRDAGPSGTSPATSFASPAALPRRLSKTGHQEQINDSLPPAGEGHS